MTILHCIPKKEWDSMKEQEQFGQPMLDASGFIHCSSVEYFWRVAPNFAKDSEERLLLCIDTDRLDAPVRWEDLEGCGREYPHIYTRHSAISKHTYLKSDITRRQYYLIAISHLCA